MAVRDSTGAADALEALFRALRPPLEFIVRAGDEAAARTTLPLAELASRARELATTARDEAMRARLAALGEAIDELAAAPASRRPAAAAACLAVMAAPAAAPPDTAGKGEAAAAQARAAPSYRRWQGDLDAALRALEQPVQFVKGVGPRRADELRKMGIATVEDLLFHLPFRYEDRRRVAAIAHAVAGAEATFIGELVHLEEKIVGRARRRILDGVVRDDTGLLGLTWYNQVAYFRSRYRRGQKVSVYGRVELDAGGGKRIVHPEMESVSGERGAGIVPIYNKPGGMSVKAMRKIVQQAVAQAVDQAPSVLPEAITRKARIADLQSALRGVHRPASDTDPVALEEMRSPAHRSLVFDELFYLQLGLALRRRNSEREAGLAMPVEGPLVAALQRRLPFALTGAQQRVIDEIGADMERPHPMHRLVQGDVGSGKTVVALHAALIAVQSGRQAAIMAPTELLAEQHHTAIARLIDGMELRVALLTSERLRRDRERVYGELAAGNIDVAIGTHALIQESVRMPRLGLAVVDEQHRFGVMQRAALRDLAGGAGQAAPDVLLMTATPIPRTLSMTIYGDLDVSLLDEMPPGRKPVRTHVVHEAERGRAYAAIRREVTKGRQAYVVFPLVESSAKLELRDATTMATELARSVFDGLRVGLLHGKMKADEKDAIMQRFRAGDLQILVSTTVVEVGVDVPNATVMVVEHAERFGLSQLHQLRGRVGRGDHASLCVLISSRHARGDDSDRLAVMRDSNDGFAIAEADLRLRGPGEFLGTRQSGLPDFRVANLLRDSVLLVEARSAALAWLDADPDLSSDESKEIIAVLKHRWQGRLGLAEIG
jgi:ATP-dependent DNA helicase RecG